MDKASLMQTFLAHQITMTVVVCVGLKLLSMSARMIGQKKPHSARPRNICKDFMTMWVPFSVFVYQLVDLWQAEPPTPLPKNDQCQMVIWRLPLLMLEIVVLSGLFCFVQWRCSDSFEHSTCSAYTQCHNIMTVIVKVPLLLNCLFSSGSWYLLTATPKTLVEQDFVTSNRNVFLVMGFYLWELLKDDPKAGMLLHHMTCILGSASMFESIPEDRAGNLLRQVFGTVGIAMATGGAPTISLPILVSGLTPDTIRKSQVMLIGAVMGSLLYVAIDIALIVVFYSNSPSVPDMPTHIFIIPCEVLVGVVPLQIICFLKMFKAASSHRCNEDCQKSVKDSVSVLSGQPRLQHCRSLPTEVPIRVQRQGFATEDGIPINRCRSFANDKSLCEQRRRSFLSRPQQ